MPKRNTGTGSVLPDHQSSPSPPRSLRSQTSSRPVTPSPLVDVPSPMGNNSPTGSSESLSHSESKQEQHLDIPGTPITHNYCATVEDVTDDEDDSESEYDTTASRRLPSSHHHSDIPPHFGGGPSNQGSSPSHDNSGLHTRAQNHTNLSSLLNRYVFVHLIILLIPMRKQVRPAMSMEHLFPLETLLIHVIRMPMPIMPVPTIGCPTPVEHNLSLQNSSTPRLKCQQVILITS